MAASWLRFRSVRRVQPRSRYFAVGGRSVFTDLTPVGEGGLREVLAVVGDGTLELIGHWRLGHDAYLRMLGGVAVVRVLQTRGLRALPTWLVTVHPINVYLRGEHSHQQEGCCQDDVADLGQPAPGMGSSN
jgi:hypothetical protein